jgi:peptidoglycan/LPS O-acetylase OafA/YrhL
MTTVKDVLNRNKGIGPGFHLLRHVLAFLILLWHARQAIWWTYSARILAANGEIPRGLSRVSHFNLDDIIRPAVHSLVGIFFILSGFLVMGSALRTRNTGKFLLNRALRIFPALGAETLLSAFILGPLVTSLTLGAYFTNPEFFAYFGNIVGWLHYTLPGVFEHNPLPNTINGQLWTLHPEFFSYLSMALLMSLSVIYQRRTLLIVFCAMLITITALYLYDPVRFDVKGENFFLTWYITILFWFGVIAYMFCEYIPLRFGYFVTAVAAYWAMMFFGVLAPLAGLALTYIMVYVGMTAFPLWDRIVKSDYSYGIYLYHFPIIQLVMWLFMATPIIRMSHVNQLMLLVPTSLVITVGFAILSWRFIEKPALRLRTVFARTEAVTPEVLATA